MPTEVLSDEILQILAGAMIGALISLVSFHYKGRKERIELINKALFYLLEVWDLLALIKLFHSGSFPEKIMGRLKKKFPKEDFSEIMQEDIRALSSSCILTFFKNRPSDQAKISSMYEQSIEMLCHVLPVKAHELRRKTLLLSYLHSIDNISEKEGNSELMEQIRVTFYETSFDEFEEDIKCLAFKSGIRNWWKVRNMIKTLKARLITPPEQSIDEYIDLVFSPLVQRHYDSLGVANPNKIIDPPSEFSAETI